LPFRRSSPARPDSALLALLPLIVLFNALPVPSIAAAPVMVRFSMFADRVWVTEDWTVSVPPATRSTATSPALSTM